MSKQTNYEYELNKIEKRRWQLWFMAFLLIIAFASTVVVLSMWGFEIPKSLNEVMNFKVLRISLMLLTAAFCVYIVEREINFRKLSRSLLEEKIKISSLNQKVHQVSALLQAGKAVNSVLDAKKVSDIILKAAFDLLGCTQGSIMLLNEKIGILKIANSYGLDKKIVAKARIKVGESISGWVAKCGKPLLLSGDINAGKYKNFAKKVRYINSAIVVPLKTKDKTIGVLSLSIGKKGSKKFDKYDLNTAQVFAEQVSVAIVNAELYEDVKKTHDELIAVNKEFMNKNKELNKANVELKDANNELEKFNKLTVDRELQMIKLKDAIKKLERGSRAS
ncbi:MAG TPA: GAF domain-containing protein [Actinobacteria bacterium]|nr:GAF domain-containing protein [Actinomycetota bacterium]